MQHLKFPINAKVKILAGEDKGQEGTAKGYYIATDEYLVKIWHGDKIKGHAHHVRIKTEHMEMVR